MQKTDMIKLREALEASWKPDTAYLRAAQADNPALGQCYPTARVVQYYFPTAEIVEGKVETAHGIEKHFWNILKQDSSQVHIDFTWRQFPHGSIVKSWEVRDRNMLHDSPGTINRVELLLSRVQHYLAQS